MITQNMFEQLLLSNKRYDNRLNRFEFQCFSQNGEDGIIERICEVLGIKDGKFVEIGCGESGLENNTTFLLMKGWKGAWFDPLVNPTAKGFIKDISENRLETFRETVTRDNVNSLLNKSSFHDIDLLSIDVDGNDYYIWEAIKETPKIVVIEYNAAWGPTAAVIQEYIDRKYWDSTSYVGASLQALAHLGNSKGYGLVACDLHGINAFFVKQSWASLSEFTTASPKELWEPTRYWLCRKEGHKSNYGPMVRF